MKPPENIKVCVRCRPLNEVEEHNNRNVVVKVSEDAATVILSHPNRGENELIKSFTFDYAFGFESKQLDIYNKVARPVVEQIFEGYNGTIFAYGQTGTGKTFTMDGVRAIPELRGITPNSFAHIFGHIAKTHSNTTFLVHVSYLEIYNEEVRDLLVRNNRTKLEIKERPDCGVYVRDLSSVMVQSPNEMEKLLNLGGRNRSTAATNMNEHSSRSHAIFSITVECSETLRDEKQVLRRGRLHLVDLAGSERQSKTGAEGQRLHESTKINLSLTTLGNVISALADGKSTHVPYRNSKLTRLLQNSLGGNSKTVMIANIGPTDYNYDESLSTLRYANRAKLIKNTVHINEDPKDALIRQFQKEIEGLRALLNEDKVLIEINGGEGSGMKPCLNKEKKEGRRLSKEQISEIESMIDADRRKLEEQKDMEVEQRNEIKRRLGEKEEELACARRAQAEVRARMEALERRLIVGGQNLLEKAEAQARLLEHSAAELRAQEERAEGLRLKLKEKKEERLNIEEKYNSLQEEAAGKRKKLQKLMTLYIQAKAEMEDLRAENAREMDGLLENIRQLNCEAQLQVLIINDFIPKAFQDVIERNARWNEDIGEWQLPHIAYAGNNMSRPEARRQSDAAVNDPFGEIYLSYSMGDGDKKRNARKGKKKRGPANNVPGNSSLAIY